MELGTERPHQLKIDQRLLRAMDDDDARWLHAWSIIKMTTFPFFSRWLADVMQAEIDCRQCSHLEREMVSLPRMNAAELSDFLQGSYVLCRLPLNEAQSKFADQVSLLVLADTVAALETFNIGITVT